MTDPRFSEVLASDPGRWPLLTRAAQDTRAAQSTTVEWLEPVADRCSCCGTLRSREVSYKTGKNLMQIFRCPFLPEKTTPTDALKTHLDHIETAMRTGIRSPGSSSLNPLMDGAISLLGHWPRKDDLLTLYVLRPTELYVERQFPGRPRQDEWITELSLGAIKGAE
jgi:hypothetical protein